MFYYTKYFDGALRVLKGLNALGVPLGLKYVTKAIYEPVYLDAVATQEAFQLSRFGKTTSYKSLREHRVDADEYLLNVRNYLTAFLGENWSPAWAQLGFLSNSLELPSRDDSRCQFLAKLATYFTNNPQFENAAKEYTAAKATAFCTPFTDARTSVEDRRVETRQKRDLRDAAKAKLDRQLTRTRMELELALDENDPRWLKFFDRIPGDLRAPERVEEVTATLLSGGLALVGWPDAPRAARYKVLKQVVGVDAEPVLAATVEDSDAQISGLPMGATVKLFVIATNGVGEAEASAPFELAA